MYCAICLICCMCTKLLNVLYAMYTLNEFNVLCVFLCVLSFCMSKRIAVNVPYALHVPLCIEYTRHADVYACADTERTYLIYLCMYIHTSKLL